MSPSRPHAPTTDGLSRRGWIILIAATCSVAAVLLAVAAFAAPPSAGRAHATPLADDPTVPGPNPAPAPLGLPPRPTPTQVATVPERQAGSLAPGDCLQLYPSPWADAYPVIDCGSPHIAQVLSTGQLPEPAGAAFPGEQAVKDQAIGLCSAPGLLNWDWVAVWNEDVQVDARYPNTAAVWESGARSYDCFVYTWSRHELTGSALATH